MTLRKLTEDEKIRMQCQAREDYEHDRATLLRQGREEGRKEGIELSIKKLTANYMKQDSSLTEEEAMNMAKAILA